MCAKKQKNEQEKPSLEDQILDVAERLFLEKGFALTSTTAIAAQVGCNQALIHYYFRTKAHLFEHIFYKKFNFFLRIFSSISNDCITVEEKIKRIVGSHFDFIASNENFPFLLINELHTNPVLYEKVKFALKQKPILFSLQELLDSGANEGRFRSSSAIDVVLLIMSLNAFPFLVKPYLHSFIEDQAFNTFLEKRKQTNIEIVLKSLQK